jgi:hypothetical protein
VHGVLQDYQYQRPGVAQTGRRHVPELQRLELQHLRDSPGALPHVLLLVAQGWDDA